MRNPFRILRTIQKTYQAAKSKLAYRNFASIR